jgi:hypothetical protein
MYATKGVRMARAYFDGTSPNSEMKYRNAGRPGISRHSVGCCTPPPIAISYSNPSSSSTAASAFT